MDVDFANEFCWEHGVYSTDCVCELCSHRYECSGSDVDDDDEDDEE